MLLEAPEKVSQDHIILDVQEIEPLLQGPPSQLKPWPGAMITLKDGRTMYIREARIEEAPAMMTYVKRVMEADHDFYDIVGARVYAEILGWYRKRLKDPYTLVGLIDGEWVGFCNGRLMNDDVNISLHTHGARPRRPHRRDHVLRQGLLRVRDARQQGVLGHVRELQRLASLGPRHGAAQLSVAGGAARARWREGLLHHARTTGIPRSRTTRARWSAPSWSSTFRAIVEANETLIVPKDVLV